MSVEGIAREVNKYAGWAWNKFPGLPHKEYEKVKNCSHYFDKFGALLNNQLTIACPGDESVITME